jgi:hypothetical protein
MVGVICAFLGLYSIVAGPSKLSKLCRSTTECADVRDESVCGDQNLVTRAEEDYKYPDGYAYCCDPGFDTFSCYRNQGDSNCGGVSCCSSGYTQIMTDQHGGKDK